MAIRKNQPHRREIRQRAALQRAEDRAQRSPAEQLQLVIERGHPNCREANRLREQIARGTEAKEVAPAEG